MPTDDRDEMEMRGGQGARVSNTAALTAYDPSEHGGSVQPPMDDSATFTFTAEEGRKRFACAYQLGEVLDEVDPDRTEEPGLIYARLTTPGMLAVEDMMKALEPGSDWARVFPAGMAAIAALLTCTCHHQLADRGLGSERRDVLLYGFPVYGGTHAFFEKVAPRYGFIPVCVNMQNLSEVFAKIKEYRNRIGLVYCETPANPTMTMVDIKAIADFLAELYEDNTRPVFAVDNTFAGIFQHPLLFGADTVVYSATKYLSGHSNLIGGFLVGKNGKKVVMRSFEGAIVLAELVGAITGHRTVLGLTPSPEMVHKLFMQMQTYIMRMKRQAETATIVAAYLAANERIARVYFPTLMVGEHAKLYGEGKQMTGPSGMIAFELKDADKATIYKFLNSLEVILCAVSLGFVRSLIEHPRSMTHSDITVAEQEKMGISGNLVRLSIGLEEPDDLIKDLKQALKRTHEKPAITAVAA